MAAIHQQYRMEVINTIMNHFETLRISKIRQSINEKSSFGSAMVLLTMVNRPFSIPRRPSIADIAWKSFQATMN
jgi:hypothetical protein